MILKLRRIFERLLRWSTASVDRNDHGLSSTLDGATIEILGTVTPPADMVAAARASLSTHAFTRLMTAVGGRPPTPLELVAAVERQRVKR